VSLAMTKQERETFLADLHIAIISIPEEGRGPLTVPIWYSYEPGGELRIVTAKTSRKAELLRHAGKVQCMCTDGDIAVQVRQCRGTGRRHRASRC
jgi:nitroimidazol reductase NimA-like FMN-containing flavoprotein (pyridoxamine 5'-phosphate oxidase superfamily)